MRNRRKLSQNNKLPFIKNGDVINIKFDKVLYGDREKPKLKDATFNIKANSINTIVGLSDSGKYCVKIPIVSIPEFAQLLSTKSMILYFPPKETAGFAVCFVRS